MSEWSFWIGEQSHPCIVISSANYLDWLACLIILFVILVSWHYYKRNFIVPVINDIKLESQKELINTEFEIHQARMGSCTNCHKNKTEEQRWHYSSGWKDGLKNNQQI